MLYEKFFETKTKGVIQGSSVLFSELPNGSSNIYDPHPARGCPWNHKELFFDETLIDTRKKPSNITACGSFMTWKIVIKSRETGETVWVRPFISRSEAFVVWARLLNLDLERIEQNGGIQYCPTTYYEGDLVYEFATVESFTSIGSTTWTAPTRVRKVQYVVVAGGGGGGLDGTQFSGGGGAGGYRANVTGEYSGRNSFAEAQYSVSQGSGYGVTVGDGSAPNVTGNNSEFSGIVSLGGGYGGRDGSTNGRPGGCGGGAQENSSSVGSGTAGQGYDGAGGSGDNYGGGGGGAGQSGFGPHGGGGIVSSITGSAVYRAGGGGGCARQASSFDNSGGLGGGSRGAYNQSPTSAATTATPNSGGGGGGSANRTSGNASAGASGIVILSYTPVQNVQINLPVLGM